MTDATPAGPPPADPTPATPGIPAGWYFDQSSGRQRWWDGSRWTENFAVAGTPAGPSNSAATASFVLGLIGFFLTPIPFFIGLFLGGIPALLAVIFGIVGISRARPLGGRGLAFAIVGLVLGSLAVLSIFVGAGTIW